MTHKILLIDYRDADNRAREFCESHSSYLIAQENWNRSSDDRHKKSHTMPKELLNSDVHEDPYKQYLKLEAQRRDLLAALDELISNSEYSGYRWLIGKRDNAEVKYLMALRIAVEAGKYDISPDIVNSLLQLGTLQNPMAVREAPLLPKSNFIADEEPETAALLAQKLKDIRMAPKDIASRIDEAFPGLSDAKLADLLPANPGTTISYSARQSRGRRLRGKKK